MQYPSYLWRGAWPPQFYSLFSVQEGKESELTYAVSFLPVARSLATAQFYSHLDGKRIADGVTEIVAMDFGERLYIYKLLYVQYIYAYFGFEQREWFRSYLRRVGFLSGKGSKSISVGTAN